MERWEMPGPSGKDPCRPDTGCQRVTHRTERAGDPPQAKEGRGTDPPRAPDQGKRVNRSSDEGQSDVAIDGGPPQPGMLQQEAAGCIRRVAEERPVDSKQRRVHREWSA